MTEVKANQATVAAAKQGDHDRVAMLSLRADGTADQHSPEIVGDVDAAVEATKRQFAEQAVSAADSARAVEQAAVETVSQDPEIEKTQKEHEALKAQAEKAAEAAVKSLHQ